MPSVTPLPLRGGQIHFTALPPLALYVHIPWCVRKCPYCDFNSHELNPNSTIAHAERRLDVELESRYVQALIADLESALPQIWGRRVHTIFFGGGTPSLLSARALDELLSGIRARLQLDPDAEITLEANPGTFEVEKFAAFRSSGINRLSIGIQSFNPKHLHALGRIHGADEARRAIAIAQTTFDNFNLDLMYALPEQTLLEAEADVATAVDFGAPHLSLYHLTIEPNTYFARFPPQVPEDELAADMQEMVETMLGESGYRHYETSAFARPGRESRHNLNYWRFGDYLGIGAGAHSKLSFPDKVLRQVRWKNPREYMDHIAQRTPLPLEHEVAPNELPFEFMMNALRLIDGFDSVLFEERTSLPLTVALRELEAAERKGLLERSLTRIAPTLKGQRFLNDLLQLFLQPQNAHDGGGERG